MRNTKSDPYLCPVCEETFDSPYQRGGHLGTHHTTEAKRESLLERLQEVADEKGGAPSQQDLDDCKWGTPSSFESVFESWQEAVKAIDCEPLRSRPSTPELLNDLHRLQNGLERTPRQKDVADYGEYSKKTYRNQFGCWSKALKEAGFEPAKRSRIPESELLEELERVATSLPHSPTMREFDQHGEFCSKTYLNRFGSWNDALELVECSPARHYNVPAEELKEELRRVGDELGKPPSVSEAKELVEYAVSTYEREFGTWNEALAAVEFGVNQHHTVPNEDLLKSLQQLANDLGSSPTVVENRRHGKYSFNAYQSSFGSWNQALTLAGLERNARNDITRGELLDELHRLSDDLGHAPTIAEMRSRGRYTHVPYAKEFGSWSKGLQEAGLTPWATRRLKPHPIYGVGWTEKLRERIRDRDGRECAACGLQEETSVEKYNRRLSVHHICGARRSENPAVFNAPRNLITVCHPCHRELESYTPGLPPYIEQPGPFPD